MRLYLGENLLMQKKYQEAKSVLAELVKVDDQPLHRKRLGDACAGAGNADDALTQYRAALKLDPNYYPALNAIGELYIIDYNKGLGLDDASARPPWMSGNKAWRSSARRRISWRGSAVCQSADVHALIFNGRGCPAWRIIAFTAHWIFSSIRPTRWRFINLRAWQQFPAREKASAFEQLAGQIGLPHSGTDDPRLRVVHRLDKDTSGVLLFAKNIEVQRHLSHQFQNNTVEKEYLSWWRGGPLRRRGRSMCAIAPHPANPKLMAVSKHGRPARTLWKVERRFRAYTLLRVFPKTGKTHQIRVHLRDAGMPLAVDPLYNPKAPPLLLSSLKRDYRPSGEERPLIARLTLHAEKLRFEDLEGKEIELVSELPKDFRAAVNQLSKVAGR